MSGHGFLSQLRIQRPMGLTLICLTCDKTLDADAEFDVLREICMGCGNTGSFTKRRGVPRAAVDLLVGVAERGMKFTNAKKLNKVFKDKVPDEKKIGRAVREVLKTVLHDSSRYQGWSPPRAIRGQDKFLAGARREFNLEKRKSKAEIHADAVGELYESLMAHVLQSHGSLSVVKKHQTVHRRDGHRLIAGKPDAVYHYRGSESSMIT